MGSPEFPGDENDRQNQFQPPPSHALPMHGIVSSEDDDADSNDDATPPAGLHNDAEEDSFDPGQPYAAEGYHPLNFEIRTTDDDSDSDNDGDDDNSSSSSNSIAADVVDGAAEVPDEADIVTTAEREILSEIWNAPRPIDSADIALDNDKAEQVYGENTKHMIYKNKSAIIIVSDKNGYVESVTAVGPSPATAMGCRCSRV